MYNIWRLGNYLDWKLSAFQLFWFGHVEHQNDADWLKNCMMMDIEGMSEEDCGIVSKCLWRVLAFLMRRLRIGIIGG